MKKLLTLILSAILCFTACFMFACKDDKKKVQIEYASPDVVINKLCNDKLEYGLLAEPAATKLEKVDGKDFTWHRLSIQELYDKDAKSYPQAVLMVKNSVLENYPQLVRAVKEKFNSESHLTGVKSAINSIKADYPLLALPAFVDDTMVEKCNISWQDGLEVSTKTAVKNYIDDILDINIGLEISPASKVQDDFFYNENLGVGQEVSGKTFTFCVPGGAPALSIVKFISNKENFISGATFNYKVVSADSQTNSITSYMDGTNTEGIHADFIILPVNAASKLYNRKTDLDKSYKMVSVITHGNLYIMSKTESTINSLEDKTIAVIGGEGKVPDLTLKTVFNKNSLQYITKA